MNMKVLSTVGILFVGIIAGIILVSEFNPESVSGLWADEKIGADKAPVVVSEQANAINNAYVTVSEAVNPTVVSISVVMEDKDYHQYQERFQEFYKFFGLPEDQNAPSEPRKSAAAGSGVIITDNGYIVTNNHVVENAIEGGITVTTYDQKTYSAELIGADPLTDLAVIKIEESGLKPAHFASMDDIHVGDFVLAVGNPLGLNSTVTAGIVSAIGRGQLYLPNRSNYSVENFIQTDAAINPGNSGGGLFNLEGSLIGINTAIATRTGTYIGYGFAIPIDLAQSVVSDLIEDGKINRGYIGVAIRTVTDPVAKATGLEKVSGVLVHNINEGSAAEKAGIEPGDIILEVDGEEVATSNELQSKITMKRAGDKVKLTIWRDGKKLFKNVTLKARDDDEGAIAGEDVDNTEEKDPAKPVNFDELGFSVEPAKSDVKKRYDVSNGVMITKVIPYSRAAQAEMFPRGIIVKADRQKIKTPGQLKTIFENKKPGDAVLMQVKYEDTYRIVAIEIPKEE